MTAMTRTLALAVFGILLAALGGCLVTFYKPKPPAPKPVAAVSPATAAKNP